MTEADLTAIEQHLGRPLPGAYRAVMQSYPLDRQDGNSRIALNDDPGTVLAWNAELREGELAAEWGGDRFAIGWSPCGDTYFLDLTGGSAAVFEWDHETHAVSVGWPDLGAFVAGWQRSGAAAAASRRADSARWRWWQFWRR